jgi:hypothetical protein
MEQGSHQELCGKRSRQEEASMEPRAHQLPAFVTVKAQTWSGCAWQVEITEDEMITLVDEAPCLVRILLDMRLGDYCVGELKKAVTALFSARDEAQRTLQLHQGYKITLQSFVSIKRIARAMATSATQASDAVELTDGLRVHAEVLCCGPLVDAYEAQIGSQRNPRTPDEDIANTYVWAARLFTSPFNINVSNEFLEWQKEITALQLDGWQITSTTRNEESYQNLFVFSMFYQLRKLR